MTSAKDDFNPFEDPSIRDLTNQDNPVTVGTYNPFEKNNSGNQITSPGGDNQGSIPPPPTSSMPPRPPENNPEPPPPNYEQMGAQKQFSADLQRRQEELEKKASELQAREARLNAAPAVAGNVKNWPPLPAKCCVGPCFYQDINVEIPDPYQKTVKTMYYLWVFYAALLFLNMLGALALFIADGSGTTFGVSLLVFFLFSPLSFVCWFRPAYKAFRSDSSFNFMVFFFVFFFQFVIAVIYAIGIPNVGSCGLLNGITTLSSRSEEHKVSTYTVGIMAVLIGFLWAIYAAASFYMLCKIHRMYRGTTASFAKAQEELATGVMRNPNVQNAAAAAATQAARSTLNQAAGGLRY